jgi:UPF0755 protein
MTDGYSDWQEPPRRRGRGQYEQDDDYDPSSRRSSGRDPQDWGSDPGFGRPDGYQGQGEYDGTGYAAPNGSGYAPPNGSGYAEPNGSGYAAPNGYGSWPEEPDPYTGTDPQAAASTQPRDAWTDPRTARTDPRGGQPDYYGQDSYPGRGDYAAGDYASRQPYRDPQDYGDPAAYRDGGYAQPAAGDQPGYGGAAAYNGDLESRDRYDDRNSYPDQQGYGGRELYNGQGAVGEPGAYGGQDAYQEPGGYDGGSYPAEPGYQPGHSGYGQGGDYDGYGSAAGSGPLQSYAAGGGYGPAEDDQLGWPPDGGGAASRGGDYQSGARRDRSTSRYQREDVGQDGPHGGSRGSVRGMDADDDRHSGFFSGFAGNDDEHYGKESRRGRSGGSGRGGSGRGRSSRGGRARGRAAGTIALLVVFAVLGGIGGGIYYAYSWYHARHASYVGDGFGSVVVTVKSGDSALSIAPQLERLGVIESQQPFVTAAAESSNPTGLQPGQFKLHRHMGPAQAWALLLSPKSRVSLRATIPDGFRYLRYLPALAKESGIPLSQFQAAIKDTAALGLPSYAKGNPEGYLFPATYDIAPGETALQVLQAAVHEFNVEATALNLSAGARRTGFTEAHIIIIASLLEAEVGPTYYAKVARVIDNRLKIGMTLGLDSTVAYALDKYTFNFTASELATPSPYNTLKYPGLPPGPIDSPGAAALKAAMNPAPAINTWLYFVTVNKAGLTLFTSSNQQFQAWSNLAKRNGV